MSILGQLRCSGFFIFWFIYKPQDFFELVGISLLCCDVLTSKTKRTFWLFGNESPKQGDLQG